MAKKATMAAELRAQAKALMDKAKKIEMESKQDLGDYAIKFVRGEITEDELKSKAVELGFLQE